MKFISDQALRQWIDQLAQEQQVIAPVTAEIGEAPGRAEPLAEGMQVLYKPVDSADEIAWGFQRPAMSAREFIFPKSDTLYTIEAGADGKKKLREPRLDQKQVVFGIRPCDARGFRALDGVMLEQDPVDVYYAERRHNTTLVGLACDEMWESCFCNSVGSAPNDPSDVDILLTQVEGGYAVQVVTEKGERLAEGMDLEERTDLALPEPKLNEPFDMPTDEQWVNLFEDVYWNRVGDRCLSCRVCSYVCPSCRCFDVRDETIVTADGEHVTRTVRSWDSCQGANYRLVAGGANPRREPGQRSRNRFYCKCYYFPVDYNVLGCVGCGRCITACPVNIDIREVLQEVAQGEEA
jgi:ferredoxin